MTVAHNRWLEQSDSFLLSAEQPAGLSFFALVLRYSQSNGRIINAQHPYAKIKSIV